MRTITVWMRSFGARGAERNAGRALAAMSTMHAEVDVALATMRQAAGRAERGDRAA